MKKDQDLQGNFTPKEERKETAYEHRIIIKRMKKLNRTVPVEVVAYHQTV